MVEENASLQVQVESLQTRNKNLEKRIEKLENEVTNSSNEDPEIDTSNAFEEFKEQKEAASEEPTDVEIFTYAQTVIEDFYPDSKFPSDSMREYKFVKTNLRYKIEGTFKENKNASYEDFCMIIEFLDDKYETYDLISLQIGKTTIYKHSN